MKKAVALFFCLQILSGNTFASELMKLPFLVQHYMDHEKNAPSQLSIADFLWEHYVSNDESDEKSGHCHEDLPFKHCHDCCSHVSTVLICVVPADSEISELPIAENEVEFAVTKQFSSSYLSQIWQPPKKA